MKKIIVPLVLVIAILFTNIAFINKAVRDAMSTNAGGATFNTAPAYIVASSTTFTVTTSASLRLLASSTPTKRHAAFIEPINCATGAVLYMNANRDNLATAGNGIAVAASTTLEMKEYPNLPVVQGALQGITSVGTCTVLVTEWRSQY